MGTIGDPLQKIDATVLVVAYNAVNSHLGTHALGLHVMVCHFETLIPATAERPYRYCVQHFLSHLWQMHAVEGET